MPRFFFHIHDGVSVMDDEGTELSGWHEAQTEAIRLAGAVLTDTAMMMKLGEDWRMDVTDERGLVLFQLTFHIAAAPVITGSLP